MLKVNEVVLRAFQMSDIEFLVDCRNDLAIEAASQSSEPRPLGPEVFKARLEACSPAVSSGGSHDLEFIVTRAGDALSTPLGIAGLYGLDRFNGITEFGVTIAASEARGLGIGFDAHLALVRYAFETLRFNRIYANVKADNHSARRTCDRLGMTEEGVLRAHRWKEGEHMNLHLYGLLSSEWDPSLINWRSSARGGDPR